MMKSLYVKRGRRYYPVGEYAPEATEMLPYGTHMIAVFPGHKIFRFQVNPDHAGTLAALQEHKDKVIKAIVDASRTRPAKQKLSAKERKAMKAYYDVMGEEGLLTLAQPSAHDIYDALERALVGEIVER